MNKNLNRLLPPVLDQLAKIGPLIWQRNWAEANGGNVSIRLGDYPDNFVEPVYYLVSRTGSRYRQFATDPMKSLMIVELHEDGWVGHDPEAGPTSEWNAHIKIHRHLRSRGSAAGVILHAHPNAVIGISHQPVFKDEARLNEVLSSMLPELPLFLPNGISCCGLHAPGSLELALASQCCLQDRNAIIWEKHGLLTIGETLDQAFDYMEVIVKACEICLTNAALKGCEIT